MILFHIYNKYGVRPVYPCDDCTPLIPLREPCTCRLPADPGDASAAGVDVSLLAGWILLRMILQANSIVLASTSFSRKGFRWFGILQCLSRICYEMIMEIPEGT